MEKYNSISHYIINILILFLFFSFVFCFLILADSKLIIAQNDNGKEINIKTGDVIQIELKQYSGTGYEWNFHESHKEYFNIIKEDIKVISTPGIVGGPVMRIWELKAIKKGEIEVKLYLYRVWEGKDKASDVFKIKINII